MKSCWHAVSLLVWMRSIRTIGIHSADCVVVVADADTQKRDAGRVQLEGIPSID